MTRLVELRQRSYGPGNEIVQNSKGENHCWNTLSIQESDYLEYKSKTAMDPRRLVNNAGLDRVTRRKSIELRKLADSENEEKKENAKNWRKRQARSPYSSERVKRTRSSAVSSNSPTSIPDPHILVNDSSRIFAYDSPGSLPSPKLAEKKKTPSRISNGDIAKIGLSKVKTTQQLIADLLAKKKSPYYSISSECGNFRVQSPDPKFSKDDVPEQHSEKLSPQSHLKSSSKNGNLRTNLAKAKINAQQLSNDESSCISSPKYSFGDPGTTSDFATESTDTPNASEKTTRSELTEDESSELQSKENSRVDQVDVGSHIPNNSVMNFNIDDMSPIDAVSVEDGCGSSHSPVNPPKGEDLQPEHNIDMLPSISETSPPEHYDGNPQHRGGVYGNYDTHGVWHPWQDCYDVEYGSDSTMRILPYVIID